MVPDPVFTRKGDDLYTEKTITLLEVILPVLLKNLLPPFLYILDTNSMTKLYHTYLCMQFAVIDWI